MKTYDENTGLEVENPDLEAGYVYPGRRKVGTEEKVLEGTVTERRPEGLKQIVTLWEDCQFYHAYTEDKLAAMQQPEEPEQEAPADGVDTWDELAAAYTEGVSLA